MTPELNTYFFYFRKLSFTVGMLFSLVVAVSFAAFSLPHLSFSKSSPGGTNTYAALKPSARFQRTYPDLTTEHLYTSRMQLLAEEESFLKDL